MSAFNYDPSPQIPFTAVPYGAGVANDNGDLVSIAPSVYPKWYARPSLALPNSNANVDVIGKINSDYAYSMNLTQGIVAAIEAKVLNFRVDRSFLIGVLVLLSSMVPPNGIFDIYGINEKLWETILATFVGGGILQLIDGGSYIKKAGWMLLIDTSSQIITDQFYTLFILGGINTNYVNYRGKYPEAGYVNRAFLG